MQAFGHPWYDGLMIKNIPETFPDPMDMTLGQLMLHILATNERYTKSNDPAEKRRLGTHWLKINRAWKLHGFGQAPTRPMLEKKPTTAADLLW